jgi:hypothetical protein
MGMRWRSGSAVDFVIFSLCFFCGQQRKLLFVFFLFIGTITQAGVYSGSRMPPAAGRWERDTGEQEALRRFSDGREGPPFVEEKGGGRG